MTTERGRTIVSGYLRPDAPGAGGASGAHAMDAVVVHRSHYEAAMGSWGLGPVRMSAIDDPDSATVTRHLGYLTERAPTMLVGVLTRGTGHLRTATQSLPMRPGALSLYPSGAPFELRFDSAYRYVVAEVPRAAIGAVGDADALCGASPEIATMPSAHVATGLLGSLPDRAGGLQPHSRARLGELIVGLLHESIDGLHGAAIARDEPFGESGPPSTGDRMLARLLAWIDDHLTDPDLGPQRIADANFISLRYLHRLFEANDTTVAETIRRRRIDRIKADLRAASLESLPVAAIGARWGIPDATSLGRLFRAVEGTTPARWRRDARDRRAMGGTDGGAA
ncbi:MAG: helix-turn-helix domain-containing protein [Pseudoclavibacter sp.]